MKTGDTITLKPKSKHGKDRVAQHGNRWTVRNVKEAQVLLESMEKTFKFGDRKITDLRWVDLKNDLDFEIVEGK